MQLPAIQDRRHQFLGDKTSEDLGMVVNVPTACLKLATKGLKKGSLPQKIKIRVYFKERIGIHTYVISNPVRIIDLVSHTTYVVCIHFIMADCLPIIFLDK